MDHYEVEGMIRDAIFRERSVWRREIEEAVSDLRATIASNEEERSAQIESLQRVLNSRTEHLV
jgi:hypothetical protein